MKLRTEMVRVDGEMRLTLGKSPGRYSAREHDAMAAHAYKQAEREANALFDSGTRWYRARAWINTRAAEILAGWMGEGK